MDNHNKKVFRVFVSSTFRDLQKERQKVIQALLPLNCIPMGMELFSTGEPDFWQVIKRQISDCDLYVLIVAGRYGSYDKDKVSYTWKEYKMARKMGKEMIVLLHSNPDGHALRVERAIKALPESASIKKKLHEFRSELEARDCGRWGNPNMLIEQLLSRCNSILPRLSGGLVPIEHGAQNILAKEIADFKNSHAIQKVRESLEKISKDLEALRRGVPLTENRLSSLAEAAPYLTKPQWEHLTSLAKAAPYLTEPQWRHLDKVANIQKAITLETMFQHIIEDAHSDAQPSLLKCTELLLDSQTASLNNR